MPVWDEPRVPIATVSTEYYDEDPGKERQRKPRRSRGKPRISLAQDDMLFELAAYTQWESAYIYVEAEGAYPSQRGTDKGEERQGMTSSETTHTHTANLIYARASPFSKPSAPLARMS